MLRGTIPHCGLLNQSDRLRLSFDVRLQLASRTTIAVGDIARVTAGSITINCDDGKTVTLRIDDETFIRTGHAGARVPTSELQSAVKAGERVFASTEADRATMLRRPSTAPPAR